MTENAAQRIAERLRPIATNVVLRSERRAYVDVPPENLLEAAGRLFQELGARYATASGMQVDGGFEVLHHFAFDAEHLLVSVRARAEGEEPELDSLANLIKGASFIEREMHDLLGIKFRGHPNLQRLILPENWPEGVYPLRHGRPWEGKVRKEV